MKSLSTSNEKDVLKLWEGLGYYRRARNLLTTSKILVNKFNSRLPKSRDEIKKLPGIGDYTASALLALVHDRPAIAVDGNVKRVFSRILNKEIDRINFEKVIKDNSKKLFYLKRNSDLVEALMEFGALICKPKDPNCNDCCLKRNCKYLKSNSKINF